jgi:hypothetical protein
MSKRQEFSVFSYIVFSGRHSFLPIAGACRTVLFVESEICIVAEHSSAFQHKLNLLQSASSSLKLVECGILETGNPIQILLKRARSNCTGIRIAERVCRAVIRFGTIRNPTAATDPGLRNSKSIQVEQPIFQLSDGA